jgi:hypothetical protein
MAETFSLGLLSTLSGVVILSCVFTSIIKEINNSQPLITGLFLIAGIFILIKGQLMIMMDNLI